MKLLLPHRRSGWTLVELVIGATITSMILASVGAVTLASSDAYRSQTSAAELRVAARRALERISRELVTAEAAGLTPQPLAPFGSDALEYHLNTGYDPATASPSWTLRRRLAWSMDPAELDNGVDDDGDGLVDEGEVVWTEDFGFPTQRSAVWVRDVAELLEGELSNAFVDDNGNGLADERGLAFELVGPTLVCRLTLQARDHQGRLLTHTAQSAIRIRN